MTKPDVSSFSTIAPLLIQEYERYLPTAFDDSMSILQKMNKMIKSLNDIGALSNSVVTQWNTVMEWVMGDGLTEDVNTKIDALVADGTFASQIQSALDAINAAVAQFKTDTNQTITDFQTSINDKVNNISLYYEDVTKYGAKLDGSTDDTVAIQNAINAAVTNGKRKIYIPGGTGMINGVRSRTDITQMGNLIVPSNFEIWLSKDAALKVITNDSPLYAIFNVNQVENVYIHGGKLIGDRGSHTYTQIPDSDKSNEWGHAITAQNVKNLIIRDMEIVDFTGDGIYVAGIYPVTAVMTENVLIENVKVDHVRRNGITIGHGKNIKIKDCTILNVNGTNPQACVDIEGESASSNSDPNGTVTCVMIEGCYFENSVNSGVALVNCKDVSILGNIFKNIPTGVVPYWGTGQITIDGNLFVSDNYTYSVQLSNPVMKVTNNFMSKSRVYVLPQTGSTYLYHILFANNMLDDSIIYVAQTVDCQNVVVMNNAFYNVLNTYSAISIAPDQTANGLIVKGNTVRVTSEHGFKLAGNNLVIKDNVIEYANQHGLYLIGNCDNCLIQGNVFKDWGDGGTASDGILSDGGSKISVKDNVFELSSSGSVNAHAGINLWQNASDAMVQSNLLNGISTRTYVTALNLVGSNIVSVNNLINASFTNAKQGVGIVATPTLY